MLWCLFSRLRRRERCLSRSPKKRYPQDPSRRQFLRYCQGAPLVFFPSKLPLAFLGRSAPSPHPRTADEMQIHPQYRVKLGIEDVLRKVPAGLDQFVNEKYQDEISAVLEQWAAQLLASPRD